MNNFKDIFMAVLSGAIVCIMVTFNSQLSDYCGVYLSTMVIHLIGLITFIIVMKIKKQKIELFQHLPLWLYSGGAIGVLTVIFNNISVTQTGATLFTALSLLGQILTSLYLEKTGALSTPIHTISKRQILSLLFIILGIGVML